MQIVTIDTLVPKDHILRLVDEAIDFSFIYDLVKDSFANMITPLMNILTATFVLKIRI